MRRNFARQSEDALISCKRNCPPRSAVRSVALCAPYPQRCAQSQRARKLIDILGKLRNGGCEFDGARATDHTSSVKQSGKEGATLCNRRTQIPWRYVLVAHETERTQATSHTRLPAADSLAVLVVDGIQVGMARQRSNCISRLLDLRDDFGISDSDLITAAGTVAEPHTQEVGVD